MKLFSLSTIALGALLVPTGSIAVAEDTPSSSVEDSTPEEPECYTSLSDVYDRLENHYKDNGEMNTFVICPNTAMDIGFLKPGVGIENGQSAMIPRPNTEFLCGHDGKSSNNCVLEGGDFGLIMVPVFFSQHRKVENVTVSGFTFRGQKQYAIFAASQGDLEVNDCIFEDATTFAPVVFNYNSSLNFPKLEPGESREGTTLDVLMKDCTFRNLRQHEPRLGVEAGIVNVKGADNVVTMQNCLFVDNHYGNATVGYAIQAENATVVLENNCFIGNEFRGTGAVLVVGPKKNHKVSGNFATEDPHLDCALGAAQDGDDDDFECLSNDQAAACNIDWYVGNHLQDKDVVQSS